MIFHDVSFNETFGTLDKCNGKINEDDDINISILKLGIVNILSKFTDNTNPVAKLLIILYIQAYFLQENVQKSGGCKKQTKERIMLGGKSKVIYVGKRGGKYVRQNGKFVSIKKL